MIINMNFLLQCGLGSVLLHRNFRDPKGDTGTPTDAPQIHQGHLRCSQDALLRAVLQAVSFLNLS